MGGAAGGAMTICAGAVTLWKDLNDCEQTSGDTACVYRFQHEALHRKQALHGLCTASGIDLPERRISAEWGRSC